MFHFQIQATGMHAGPGIGAHTATLAGVGRSTSQEDAYGFNTQQKGPSGSSLHPGRP